MRGIDAGVVGRWRGMQTTARRVSATAPAPRIALRIMNQLSGGRWLIGPCDPTILRWLMPARICGPIPHDPSWGIRGEMDVSVFNA